MFKKLFGTDGIRGKWGEEITPELAFEIGKAVAIVFERENTENTIVVGRDPRLSSTILENSLISGITAKGVNVVKLGIVPTAVVPFSISKYNANGAVMITASHNPATDNGFKFFNGNGFRIAQEQENHIEHIISNSSDFALNAFNSLGKVIESDLAIKKYIKMIRKELKGCSKNLKICFDCSNGASSMVVKEIFKGYNCKIFECEPNGININENCGALCLDNLKKHMKEGAFDVGFSFDGDADRVQVILKNGKQLSGEEIMYYLVKNNNFNSLVTTKMTNMALPLQLEKEKINCHIVDVGENNILQGLLETNSHLGGENNGHYLFLDYGQSSDGILTSAQIMSILSKYDLSKEPFPLFDKFEKSIRVKNKNEIMENESFKDKISFFENLLADRGRILVRASGTESLIRILVEGKDKEEITEIGIKIENEILKLSI